MRKPYPSMGYYALSLLNKMPEDFHGAIMIGDREDDMNFALNFGHNVHFVGVLDEQKGKVRKSTDQLVQEFNSFTISTPQLKWIA